jgi:hypothetical protein
MTEQTVEAEQDLPRSTTLARRLATAGANPVQEPG